MAFTCDNCSKGVMVGKTHKHHPGVAGGRWKKRAPKTAKLFRPNLHSARVLVGTNYQRLKLCTKCLRLAKEAMSERLSSGQKGQKQLVPQPLTV